MVEATATTSPLTARSARCAKAKSQNGPALLLIAIMLLGDRYAQSI